MMEDDYISRDAAAKQRLEPGTLVQIKSKKSSNDGAFGIVVGYCNGMYPNIVRVRLDKKKIIHIYDHNVEVIYTPGGAIER